MEIVELISSWFWETIEKAEGDSTKLWDILWQFTERETSLFQYEYETAICAIVEDVEDIIKLEHDEAREFSGWIISQGREFFINIYNNPSMILDTKPVDFDPRLIGVASKVYLSKFRDFLPIPQGGYWYFLLDPWVGTPEYQKHEGNRGILIHNEFLSRFNLKSN